MKAKIFLGAILTIITISGSIFAADAKAGKPPITMEDAKIIALKRIPGEVESSQMHKKDYSFEITHDGIRTNVVVSEKGKIKRLVDK